MVSAVISDQIIVKKIDKKNIYINKLKKYKMQYCNKSCGIISYNKAKILFS